MLTISSILLTMSAMAHTSEWPGPHLEAAGEADTLVAPDIAFAYIGQSGEGGTPEIALGAIAGPASRLEALFSRMGIDSSRIETVFFSLGRVRPSGKSAQESRGPFRAEKTYKVQFQDFMQLQAFLQEAVKTGSNVMRGVEFEFKESKSLEAILAVRAITDAQNTLGRMAETLGVKVGNPISAVHSGITGPPVGAFRSGAALETLSTGPGLRDGLFEIHPRKVRVSTRIVVRIGIRP